MTPDDMRAQLAKLLTCCVQDAALTGWEYTLTCALPLPIPDDLRPRGAVVTQWGALSCEPPALIFEPNYSTDGCTAVPDFSHGSTFSRCQYELQHYGPTIALRRCGPFVAHWFHDWLYQHAVEVAAAWACSVWAVIRYANRLFLAHMDLCGTPKAQRLTYYAGVCLLGHQFAWFGRQKRGIVSWFKRKENGNEG